MTGRSCGSRCNGQDKSSTSWSCFISFVHLLIRGSYLFSRRPSPSLTKPPPFHQTDLNPIAFQGTRKIRQAEDRPKCGLDGCCWKVTRCASYLTPTEGMPDHGRCLLSVRPPGGLVKSFLRTGTYVFFDTVAPAAGAFRNGAAKTLPSRRRSWPRSPRRSRSTGSGSGRRDPDGPEGHPGRNPQSGGAGG